MSRHAPIQKHRLLVVLPAPAIGGAETRTLNLLRRLNAFECALLTQAEIAGFFADSGVRVHHFDDYGCTDPCRLSPKNILNYAWAIGVVARRERAKVVLAFMHHGTLYASSARMLGLFRAKLIGTILGNISAYFDTLGRPASAFERWIIRRCVRTPDSIITPSAGVREDLVFNHGALPGKVKLIYNGVDVARCRTYASRTFVPLTKNTAWIVSASRLCSQKDYRTLLEAFRQVLNARPARLIIVGDGELRASIQRWAEQLEISDNVILVGFQENPFQYMAKADVFVLSSFFEGFGNVLVEAMALGVPVVSSDCPSGPGEIIENGRNGFLVPVGDAAAMAARILQLLGNDELRRVVIDAGLRTAERFNAETMANEFERHLLGMI